MNNNVQDRFFSICVDDFQATYEGSRYLLQLGHRRINFIDDFRKDLPNLSTDRYYGYRKALDEAGIAFKEDHKFSFAENPTENEIEQIFKELFKTPDPPTAFFCLDDEIALRVWHALNHLGYRIPEDISIVAFGDLLDYSKPYTPPLNTLFIDMTALGKLAAEMLKSRLEKNDTPTNQVLKLKPTMHERNSCQSLYS